MTPTDIEKINREFAEKVMGFKVASSFKGWLPVGILFSDFDPYHRWDHAAIGLEKFDEWTVEHIKKPFYDSKLFYCRIDNGKGCVSAFSDTAPAAICLACIEALKEKE
jgi:hypothetical protein